jgi:hypothetical protein
MRVIALALFVAFFVCFASARQLQTYCNVCLNNGCDSLETKSQRRTCVNFCQVARCRPDVPMSDSEFLNRVGQMLKRRLPHEIHTQLSNSKKQMQPGVGGNFFNFKKVVKFVQKAVDEKKQQELADAPVPTPAKSTSTTVSPSTTTAASTTSAPTSTAMPTSKPTTAAPSKKPTGKPSKKPSKKASKKPTPAREAAVCLRKAVRSAIDSLKKNEGRSIKKAVFSAMFKVRQAIKQRGAKLNVAEKKDLTRQAIRYAFEQAVSKLPESARKILRENVAKLSKVCAVSKKPTTVASSITTAPTTAAPKESESWFSKLFHVFVPKN